MKHIPNYLLSGCLPWKQKQYQFCLLLSLHNLPVEWVGAQLSTHREGTSLMTQRMGLTPANAGEKGPIRVQKASTWHGVTEWEPDYRAHVLQRAEACALRAWALHKETPAVDMAAKKRSPCSPQLEKASTQQHKRASAAPNGWIKIKLLKK